MRYIKLDLSIGDKLRLLFFGLVSEDKLPEKIVEKEKVVVEREIISDRRETVIPENINTSEPEFSIDIPFFSEDDGDVKSNF